MALVSLHKLLFFINGQMGLKLHVFVLCLSCSSLREYRPSVCLSVTLSVKARFFEARILGIVCFYIQNDTIQYLEFLVRLSGLIKIISHPRLLFCACTRWCVRLLLGGVCGVCECGSGTVIGIEVVSELRSHTLG